MLRILIIDDNQNFKRLLAKVLRSRFTAVIEEVPPEPDQIIKAAKRLSPQVIFMDMQTLKTACFDLAGKIRKSHPGVRIIFLTSFDVMEYRDAAYSGGADYCLRKNSSTPEGLLALVECALQRSSKQEAQSAPQERTGVLKGGK